MNRHYESGEWTDKSLRRYIVHNYSLLDFLFGRWRFKSGRIGNDCRSYISMSQRHQINSRFL